MVTRWRGRRESAGIRAKLTEPENAVKLQNEMYFNGCFLIAFIRESSPVRVRAISLLRVVSDCKRLTAPPRADINVRSESTEARTLATSRERVESRRKRPMFPRPDETSNPIESLAAITRLIRAPIAPR